MSSHSLPNPGRLVSVWRWCRKARESIEQQRRHTWRIKTEPGPEPPSIGWFELVVAVGAKTTPDIRRRGGGVKFENKREKIYSSVVKNTPNELGNSFERTNVVRACTFGTRKKQTRETTDRSPVVTSSLQVP